MDWVGPTFEKAVEVARSETSPAPGMTGNPPAGGGHCDHCHYVELANQHQITPDLNI